MVGTIKWGIAGCGWVARDYGVPAILLSRNGDLAALYDPDPLAVAGLAPEQRDVVRETSLEAFLRAGRLDAVYVAAPNHVHRLLVEAAAAAGCAVLCEKPMALSMADASAMVDACARNGTFYATAFDQRFHAAHRRAARMIGEGAVGQVAAIRIVYACWVGSSWSDDNWRIDPARAGGGAFFDLAPHGLDLVAMLLNEPITDAHILAQHKVHEYSHAGGVDDGAVVIARSASGVLIQMHVAYNCPEFLPRRRLEIVGDRGQMTLTDTMGQTPGGLFTLQTADRPVHEILVADIEDSPFAVQIEAFADHLLGMAPFGFTATSDLQTMRLLAGLQSGITPAGGKT